MKVTMIHEYECTIMHQIYVIICNTSIHCKIIFVVGILFLVFPVLDNPQILDPNKIFKMQPFVFKTDNS